MVRARREQISPSNCHNIPIHLQLILQHFNIA